MSSLKEQRERLLQAKMREMANHCCPGNSEMGITRGLNR